MDEQNTQTLEAYNVADVALNYGLNDSVELYAGVNNVTDEDVDILLGGTVGRYYFTGVRANFQSWEGGIGVYLLLIL